MKVVAVTIAAGRHRHLLAQRTHLRALADPPRHVVVSMGDPALGVLLQHDPDAEVIDVEVIEAGACGDRLPLARARNTGIARALDLGADLVIALDVDCLPGPHLVERYVAAARALGDVPALLCGPVTYLPAEAGSPSAGDLGSWTSPHPARPAPPPGALERDGDHRLFWSLSFALTPATWSRLGGFCTDYTGYGGEDTDVGFTARERGIDLVWVGGADAYHLWHPVSSPPRPASTTSRPKGHSA